MSAVTLAGLVGSWQFRRHGEMQLALFVQVAVQILWLMLLNAILWDLIWRAQALIGAAESATS